FSSGDLGVSGFSFDQGSGGHDLGEREVVFADSRIHGAFHFGEHRLWRDVGDSGAGLVNGSGHAVPLAVGDGHVSPSRVRSASKAREETETCVSLPSAQTRPRGPG